MESSFDNLIPIPIKSTNILKLCYTFNLCIEDAMITSAWYSVEQNKESKKDNRVFIYEINRKSEIFDDLITGFKYLVELNSDVKEILQTSNSRLLNI